MFVPLTTHFAAIFVASRTNVDPILRRRVVGSTATLAIYLHR
jgi:hypothetical protein